ncbi:crossover junction endodeoxyribonuclease RusA [Agrobacterium tumefaciens]|uniref:Crossover junction endodeoxyribonuclease RusA n=1 Tax=Agrobacterium tumefaciens TaxID=358 RepID=A0AAW8LKY7_AGRTU|nr:RusA family crossover junction endodeoxyribonuclease [Agrobacterium tumefaciens]MBP2564509.1 crossover junction endodeoxyribonuclease RusA [Agrobacterium tumefaciens]MDR6701626.1 crossover junction endodeoxyribonuclease RusA [Agrobacterium tumefaciens]
MVKSFNALLPFPPSVNNLFLNVSRGGRVKTAKYRQWEKEADASMPSGIVRLNGEVVALYTFGRPDKRRRDVANLEKAVGDTLTRWGVLEDDYQIVDIRLRWGKDGEVKPGQCRVELVEAA